MTEQPIANPRSEPRSLAEWTSFGIASAILAAIVGMVGWLWRDEARQQPPEIAVERSGEIRSVSGQFYVPFSVINSGGGTAESVQVMGDLVVNGEVQESGEQQIDFLSGGETEEGAFVFSENPQNGEVVLRIASYKLP
ncbi:TIGR02588 family protein [Microcoleus sp. FACHB-1515]|uniref:TIGR02588 family protein n=1 Tax=Cyanophyceae TaxID=3028117 RepID=UPI0016896F41|nr:TIGR02588 family protein [Microcoleus sp. FACHB-1515]MBD2089924.1 TIGR02588 family protein [Microcoleus sp. FACHB-1515]